MNESQDKSVSLIFFFFNLYDCNFEAPSVEGARGLWYMSHQDQNNFLILISLLVRMKTILRDFVCPLQEDILKNRKVFKFQLYI